MGQIVDQSLRDVLGWMNQAKLQRLNIPITWSSMFLLLGAIVLLHRASIAIYNVYFHPLRNFPGDKLWAISRYPSLHAVINGRIPHDIQRAHARYGPVVRIGPDELSFVQPEAWKAIYVGREFVRPTKWASQPPGVKVHNLVSAPQADHTRLRKALGTAFSDRAVKLQEPMIHRYVDVMMQKLGESVATQQQQKQSDKQPFTTNIIEWLSYATFDIINDFSYGSTTDCLNKQSFKPWKMVVRQYEARLYGVYLRYYPLLAYFGMPAAAMAALFQVKDIADGAARTRLADKSRPDLATNKSSPSPSSSSKPQDILSHVFAHNASSPTSAMTDDEILENSVILILAGGDPVTTVLAGALHHLLQQRAALQRLVSEIREAFVDERAITPTAARDLPFLHAVLNEAMRLGPPTPDSIRRTIPRGGAVVAGSYVPEGTIVGMSCYAAFRYAGNFEAAGEFRPERWVRGEGGEKAGQCDEEGEEGGCNVAANAGSGAGGKDDGFHPFGVGAHNCLGQTLAWVELRLILARLLWRFDLSLVPGKRVREWSEQRAYWAWDKDDLDVEVRVRGDL